MKKTNREHDTNEFKAHIFDKIDVFLARDSLSATKRVVPFFNNLTRLLSVAKRLLFTIKPKADALFETSRLRLDKEDSSEPLLEKHEEQPQVVRHEEEILW